MKIKRQYIYIILFLSVSLPLIAGLSFKVRPGDPVNDFYGQIEKLKKGDYVAIMLSYDPSTKAELDPMVYAVSHHLFERGIIPVFMNPLNAAISNLGYKIVSDTAKRMEKNENSDFYFLGYVPGDTRAIQNLGEDFYSVYSKNYNGDDIRGSEIFNDIKRIGDFPLLIDISDGNSTVEFLTYVNTKYHVPVIAGVTAIMAGQYYTYLNSKQLLGLLGGLSGSAEYETILDINGGGRRGIASQTFAHILILILVLIGNYEFVRKKK